MAAQRLYLIDGYSNIFRAFYAIRNLSNSKGEPTNAVYGFVTMLKKLLREEKPELIGVALDVGEPTVRSSRFAEYKANRRPMPEDLVPQIPLVRRALAAYRIPMLEAPSYEADDAIGTLAKKAAAAGYEVVIVSADKDLMQLVGPGVSLFHTGRNKLYGPAEVEEDFGVPPEQVVDVLALMGDSVDNIPGVPGIGDKGAKQLIRDFGSLDALLARTSEVSRKAYREGLEQHREQALLSRELATIETGLPLEFDPEALRHDPPDVEALRKLFTELEFFSLAQELPAAPVEVVEGDSGSWAAALPAADLISETEWTPALKLLGKEKRLCLAPIGSLGANGAFSAIGLAALALDRPEPGVMIDFRRPGGRAAASEWLGRLLRDPHVEVVGHDLKEVLRLSAEGAHSQAALFDTMLVSYLLNSALRAHSLEEVALERLGTKAIPGKEAGLEKGEVPLPGDSRLLAFAGERASLPGILSQPLRTQLEGSPALAGVYREIEAPLLPVLVGMEEAGVALDAPYLARMSEELGTQLQDLEQEIYALAGERFNINSPPQLGAILFEKLGYPVLGRTRKTKNYTTGAETLEELALRGYPLPERVLRYRELAKLKSTYVDALPLILGADGRLHTRYEQAVAATGRLSSVNPNLQNIPVRTEVGLRIRRAFVAPEGYVLLAADYSQVELRILAHIAGEGALIDAFRRGEDIHRSTAASVLGVASELVTSEQRRAAKVINFGIMYGMSAFGLAKNLGISTGEADHFIRSYLDRFPAVRRYMEETLAAVQREGRVETLYGRVRQLPDIASKNYNLRENARRMAINARIQGTAADLQKKAMIAVAEALCDEHPAARLLLTVHDELVLEVPEAEAEAVARTVQREMEGVAQLSVPLAVETGWGKNWYEAKK